MDDLLERLLGEVQEGAVAQATIAERSKDHDRRLLELEKIYDRLNSIEITVTKINTKLTHGVDHFKALDDALKAKAEVSELETLKTEVDKIDEDKISKRGLKLLLTGLGMGSAGGTVGIIELMKALAGG